MKKTPRSLCLALFGAGALVACTEEETAVPEPIAPILKEIAFPKETEAIPGRETTIRGKGFSVEDKVFLENAEGTLEVELVEATNDYISFLLPKDAGGSYSVAIERAGKRTTLDGSLSVPFVVVLENVVLPEGNVQPGQEVLIKGEGFDKGDVISLSAGFYPEDKEINLNTTLTSDGLSFTLPAACYGVNNVAVVRGNRQSNLGTIQIEVNIGDELGGGVVFWTDAEKVHGLICNRTNTGTPTEQFGPSVALSGAAGTSKVFGSGKENTEKLVEKIAAFRQSNSSWDNKKSAAEMCGELVVTEGSDTYSDWFLPSQEELIELFKNKAILESKGAGIPPNNYWSSSEGDGDAAGWSAYYVNFYEAENIISANSDKEGWQIGIRAIRAF